MVFNNVYEMITSPAVVKKSWFVDYCDGDAIRAWWTRTDNIGTGSDGSDDAVNSGIFVQSGSASVNNSHLNFGDIRHYSNTASVCEFVYRRNLAGLSDVGLSNPTGSMYQNDMMVIDDRSTQTFKRLATNDTGTETFSNSSIGVNTSNTRVRLEINSSNARMWIAGILEVTKTTDLPTVKLQPIISAFRLTTNVATHLIYYEAYNT